VPYAIRLPAGDPALPRKIAGETIMDRLLLYDRRTDGDTREKAAFLEGFCREVIPVHDLKVRLNLDVKRVLLVPGEQELPVRRSGGTAEVVVPKLEMHSMLVVE
jgi:hypothetical protein